MATIHDTIKVHEDELTPSSDPPSSNFTLTTMPRSTRRMSAMSALELGDAHRRELSDHRAGGPAVHMWDQFTSDELKLRLQAAVRRLKQSKEPLARGTVCFFALLLFVVLLFCCLLLT